MHRTERLRGAIRDASLFRRTGTVTGGQGAVVTARGIRLAPGELALIEQGSGEPVAAQFAGARDGETAIALLERAVVQPGARVQGTGGPPLVPVGPALVGRVLDGLGRPVDDRGPLWAHGQRPNRAEPPHALARGLIREAMPTGVRAIDALLTLGVGQRAGIFSGSGVGKSTLLGMLTRGTQADVAVVALIGERGREVREFIEHDMGPDALRHSVVVVATGDAPSAMRLCAAETATAIAEGFRDQGKRVLLVFDSLTRVAMAQREIGLAAGEPPASRGYPPSVFGLLPHLMERSGPGATGAITAVYTVLADSEEMDDPVSEIARATLDGHIILRRSLAGAGHYPPIDILASASRLMPRIVTAEHLQAAARVRELLAAFEDARDLISIGAYVEGSDETVDAAVALMPAINALLRQEADASIAFEDAVAAVTAVARVSNNEPAPGDGAGEEVAADATDEAAA